MKDDYIDRHYEETKPTQKSFFADTPPWVIVLFVAGAAVVFYLYMNKSTNTSNIFIFALIIFILIILLKLRTGDPEMLSEKQARIYLFMRLKEMQNYTRELPMGEIFLGDAHDLLMIDRGDGYKPHAYMIMFKIIDHDKLDHYYVGGVGAYPPPNLIHMRQAPGGYNGEEFTKVKWILSPKVREESEYHKRSFQRGSK